MAGGLIGTAFLLPLVHWGVFRDAALFPKWILGIGFATFFLLLSSSASLSNPASALFGSRVPHRPIHRHAVSAIGVSPLTWLVLLTIWHLITLPFAIAPSAGIPVIGCLAAAIVWYCAGARLVSGPAHRLAFAMAVTLAGIGISGIGLIQVADIAGRGGNGPVTTFGHRNFTGQFLIMMIPMALYIRSVSRSQVGRILGSIAVVLGSTTLLATACRGAWLGLATAGIVSAGLAFRRRTPGPKPSWRTIAPGVLFLACTVIAIPMIRDRVVSISDIDTGTNRFRILVWNSSLSMVRDHPAVGVGPGGFGHVYPRYRSSEERRLSGEDVFVRVAHNDLLHIAVETGVIGGLLGILFLGSVFRRSVTVPEPIGSVHDRFHSTDTRFQSAARTALIATAVQSMVSMNFRNPVPLFLFMVISGSLSGIPPVGGVPAITNRLRQFGKIPAHLVALVLIAGTGLSAWRQVESQKGMVLEIQGRHDDAARYFIRAASIPPGFYNDWYHAGYNQLMAGHPEQAVDTLQHALQLSPWFTNALFNLGIAYDMLHDTAHAMDAYDRVLAIDPIHEDTLINQGLLLTANREYPRAEAIFRRALVENPFSPDTMNNLGIVFIHTGRIKEAQEMFHSGLRARRCFVIDDSTTRHLSLFGTIRFRAVAITA
ncbi:O-antigen ligase family protein, partial [bacterium]|nr:O-antigen ligase family protein [candidate division CSSED10-310 bacterium]